MRGVRIDSCWEEDGVDESIARIYVGDMMKMDARLTRDEAPLHMSVQVPSYASLWGAG